MAKITELKMRGKKLVEVFVDDISVGKLSVDAVVSFGFKTGVEVDIEKLNKVQYESTLILAKEKALNIVSRSPHTELQVYNKLKTAGFDEKVCDSCIDFLKQYNYLNDEEYASLYIQLKGNKIGKNKIILDLMKRL